MEIKLINLSQHLYTDGLVDPHNENEKTQKIKRRIKDGYEVSTVGNHLLFLMF